MTSHKIIFFGNGPLADYAKKALLENNCEIVFHAREREDLEEVKRLKSADKNHELHGILASFGVIIKQDVLDLFEPEGILNIHPSLLPKYRGPSPIETAILNGDKDFSVSVMKLVAAMDAGPIYYQKTLDNLNIAISAAYSHGIIAKFPHDVIPTKNDIYCALATSGASWLAENLSKKPLSETCPPTPQNDQDATYTQKFDKSMSSLDPAHKTATELFNQIRAFAGFPKSKYEFFSLDCIIISAHVATPNETIQCLTNDNLDNNHNTNSTNNTLYIPCYDNSILVIDEIQPAGRKVMDAKSFLNGYAK